MEHGMPCQSGRGMGIDRILALFTEQSNIRDVVLFPIMKPIHNNITKTPNTKKTETQTPETPTDYGTLPPIDQINQLAEKYLTKI